MVGHAGSPTGVLHVDMTRIQVQGQGYGASQVPKIAENCTFLDLYPPRFQHGAQQ